MDSSSVHPHVASTVEATTKADPLARVRVVLGLIIASVTILAPFLNFIGFVFYQGSLQPYGIDSSFFPLTTQEYFSQAYMFFLDDVDRSGARILVLCALFAGFAVLWRLVLHPDIKWPEKKETTLTTWLKRQRILKVSFSALAYGFVTFYVQIGILMFFLFIFVLPPAVAYEHAKAASKSQMAAHKPCVYGQSRPKAECVFIMSDKDKIYAKGLLVARSNQYIALYEDGQVRLYPGSGREIVTLTGGEEKAHPTSDQSEHH